MFLFTTLVGSFLFFSVRKKATLKPTTSLVHEISVCIYTGQAWLICAAEACAGGARDKARTVATAT